MTISLFSQWDGTTAANNVDLNDIPLTENQTRPAHVNNAFRNIMQQLKAALGTLASVFTAASASSAASLAFHEDTDNGTNKITVTAPASVASDKTLTLPDETATVQTRVGTTTDNAVARFDGTSGVQQNSAFIVDDTGHVTSFGGNITFPASQSASADANTFDDYEEGTFTPALAFGGGSTGLTYSGRSGHYRKLASVVFWRLNINLSAKGSSTGSAKIGGLPFTIGTDGFAASGFNSGYSGLTGMLVIVNSGAQTTSDVYQQGATASAAVTDAAFTNTTIHYMGGWYQV